MYTMLLECKIREINFFVEIGSQCKKTKILIIKIYYRSLLISRKGTLLKQKKL